MPDFEQEEVLRLGDAGALLAPDQDPPNEKGTDTVRVDAHSGPSTSSGGGFKSRPPHSQSGRQKRAHIDQRVQSGQYGNTSEYLRELVRRDQGEQARKRLRDLIEAGLNSGVGRTLTPEVAMELRQRALGN
jgi:antitoxin ParD1/3/4